jgi:prepilin-type processing-associated H-X9-DG protein
LAASSWAGGGLAGTFNTGDSTNVSFLVNPYGKWPDGVVRHYSGLLGYYEQDPRLFQSPGGSIWNSGVEWPRVRSFSMNGLILGSTKVVDGWTQNAINNRYDIFRSISDFRVAKPAFTFVLITERPDSIGIASFAVNEGEPPKFPAFHENGGANLSFADGHVENWQWRGPVFLGKQNAPIFPSSLGAQDQLDADRLWRAATAR